MYFSKIPLKVSLLVNWPTGYMSITMQYRCYNLKGDLI